VADLPAGQALPLNLRPGDLRALTIRRRSFSGGRSFSSDKNSGAQRLPFVVGFRESSLSLLPLMRPRKRRQAAALQIELAAILWSAGACSRFHRPNVLPCEDLVGALLAAPAATQRPTPFFRRRNRISAPQPRRVPFLLRQFLT